MFDQKIMSVIDCPHFFPPIVYDPAINVSTATGGETGRHHNPLSISQLIKGHLIYTYFIVISI